MSSNFTDTELLESLRMGDLAAFKTLYDRYAPDLLGFALAKIGSLHEAEDAVQEVFVGFWTRSLDEGFRPEDMNIAAYLRTSVKHYAFRYHKKMLRAQLLRNLAAAEDRSTEYTISHRELKRLLDDELDQMPGQMRRVFELSRQNGLSIREIALELSLSEQTVKNHMGRALRRLRLRLGHLAPLIILFFR